jgi:TonB family protein
MKRISFKPLAAFALALATTAPSALAASDPDGALLWLHARVEISPQGKVASLEWADANDANDANDARAAVARRVESAVKSWTFEPGTIDGVPQPTSTALRLKLRAEPQGESLAVRIEDASTGAHASTLPPRYPEAAARAGAEAAVVATVAVAADGAVSVESLDVRTNRSRFGEQFGRATRAAIAGWTFEPERVGGHPVATRMQVPVTFCLNSYTCEDRLPAPADREASLHRGAIGQPVALQSAVRLVDDVAGRVL